MSKKKRQPKPTSPPKTTPPVEPVENEDAPPRGPALSVQAVPRVVSLVVLLAVLVLFGSLFFKVMREFISPLFLAGVLAVIFEPLHKWFLTKLKGRRYVASMATTTSIVLLVFVPLTWLVVLAGLEIPDLVSQFQTADAQAVSVETTRGDGELVVLQSNIADEQPSILEKTRESREQWEAWIKAQTGVTVNLGKYLTDVASELQDFLLGFGADTFVAVIGLSVGVTIMAFALYYFLADGPVMIESLMHLSPLDDAYERELLEKFAEVSRAVVVATLLSALAQGLLAGVGYYFALPSDAPVFLLTVATMLMAIVPFVGAMAVWAPVALCIVLFRGEVGPAGEFLHTGLWPGGLLALYGFAVVSTVDNFIKPWVLHGQSNLHPLLALLSVLGGVSVLGPIGILVGPMLVAFLQALLNMLRKELDHFTEPNGAEPNGAEPNRTGSDGAEPSTS